MTHKFLLAPLVAAALLMATADLAVAQAPRQTTTMGASAARARSAPSGASGLGGVPQGFAQLRLAPGYLVSLDVMDDTDFTGAFRVDEDGNILVPVLGTVHVGGLTVPEAREIIRKGLLEGKILLDPQVQLSLIEYTAPEVTIMGEVTAPGKYPLLAPRRLIDVLMLAGGLTTAAGNQVLITRGGGDGASELVHFSRATEPKDIADVTVRPGDTVQVKRAGIVYVLGSVNRAGGYAMQEEGTLSVLQAMTLAGGTNSLASNGTIYLLRRNPDGSAVYISLPLRKMIHGKSADVELHATDILFVPSNRLMVLYSNTQQLVYAAGTSAIYSAFNR